MSDTGLRGFMKFLSFLSIFFLVGCSLPKISKLDSSVKDQTFKPYIDKFYQNSILYNSNPSYFAKIDLGYTFNDGSYFDNNESTLGICRVDEQRGVIAINPRYWNSPNFSEVDKQVLFDHELSHCLLYRDHLSVQSDLLNGLLKTIVWNQDGTSTTEPILFPESLMNPYHVYDYYKSGPCNSFFCLKREFVNNLLPNHYYPELYNTVGKPTISFNSSKFDDKFEKIYSFKITKEGCEHSFEDPNLEINETEDSHTNQ